MANLIRSPKSGSDWNINDLHSYHITLTQVDAFAFFGLQELPKPSVDLELLSNGDANTMHHDSHAELITHMDLARIPEEGEPGVIDFTVELFKTLRYAHRERVARTRTAKRLENMDPDSARTRLMAAAVAAFNENNAQRDPLGLQPMKDKVRAIPGIVMVGTSPVFLQIPVTQNLSTHIRHGTYSAKETCVIYCHPPVPRPYRRYIEGVKPLDNRRAILGCYEAFKTIAGM